MCVREERRGGGTWAMELGTTSHVPHLGGLGVLMDQASLGPASFEPGFHLRF